MKTQGHILNSSKYDTGVFVMNHRPFGLTLPLCVLTELKTSNGIVYYQTSLRRTSLEVLSAQDILVADNAAIGILNQT